MAYTVSTDMSTIPQYYDKLFLERLVPAIALYDIADKKPLPMNSGTVAYFPRMSASSTTVSAYKSAEGTLVTPEKVGDVRVSATIEKFRNAKAVWDIAKLTGLSTYLDEVVKEQATQASIIIDKRIRDAAYGTSSAPVGAGFSCIVGSYDPTVNNFGELSAIQLSAGTSQTITTSMIRKWVGILRGRNVKPYDDGFYKLVVHTNTEMAIQADSTWQATYQYTDPENMKKGIFGQYAGAQMVRDNNILVSAAGCSGANLYYSLLLGHGSIGVTELDGGVKTYMKESGPTDTYNPVDEFVTFGWKISFAPVLLNISCGLIVISSD